MTVSMAAPGLERATMDTDLTVLFVVVDPRTNAVLAETHSYAGAKLEAKGFDHTQIRPTFYLASTGETVRRADAAAILEREVAS